MKKDFLSVHDISRYEFHELLDLAAEGRFADGKPQSLDETAIGALQAIREAGLRCPEDIAVVGYDDILVAEHTRPPLSTVRVPAFQLGRTAAEMLFSLILSEKETPSRVSLAPSFIERASSSSGQEHTNL